MTTRIKGPKLLLCPQIPKPMHGVNPRSIMGQQWWDINRRIAYQLAGYCCEACGVHKRDAQYHSWLEAHEWYTIDYAAGQLKFEYLVALCHACHNYIHQGRLREMVRQGKVPLAKYHDILTHGDKILRNAGLNPDDKQPFVQNFAPWNEWRLLFDGKEYKPNFADFEAWHLHYRGELPNWRAVADSALDNDDMDFVSPYD